MYGAVLSYPLVRHPGLLGAETYPIRGRRTMETTEIRPAHNDRYHFTRYRLSGGLLIDLRDVGTVKIGAMK